jgi:hypothetical protein
LAIVTLLVLIVALVLVAIAAVVPGPPQVYLTEFYQRPTGCEGGTGHYQYPFQFSLYNDGGQATVNVRAYLDGRPALINGRLASITYSVPGPRGAAFGQFWINGTDCNMLHTPRIAIASVSAA